MMLSARLRTVAFAIILSLGFVEIASAYYNPRTGRFLSRDPIGEPGAMLARNPQLAGKVSRFVPRDAVEPGAAHTYAYVGNHPTVGVDPLGLAPTVRWFVDIRKSQANPISLDAVLRVTAIDKPCCFCDSIYWVQIVDEISASLLFAGGTNGWSVDNPSHAKPPYHAVPWYIKDVAVGKPYETANGCVVSSEMRDSPGAGRASWWWRAFWQDFESCAICMRRDWSCNKGKSCVLGCVKWGHIYSKGAGHVLQPVRYPLRPSAEMMQVLGGYETRRLYFERGPIEASCSS